MRGWSGDELGKDSKHFHMQGWRLKAVAQILFIYLCAAAEDLMVTILEVLPNTKTTATTKDYKPAIDPYAIDRACIVDIRYLDRFTNQNFSFFFSKKMFFMPRPL